MRIRVPEEFVPASRFPAESADWVEWVEESGRPVVVTRGGRAVVVLVGASDYFGGGDGIAVLRSLAEEMQRGEPLVTLPVRTTPAPAKRAPAKPKAPRKAAARRPRAGARAPAKGRAPTTRRRGAR